MTTNKELNEWARQTVKLIKLKRKIIDKYRTIHCFIGLAYFMFDHFFGMNRLDLIKIESLML
ncbi:MAG: hypothetical protein KA604_03420 [Candidatus Saccharimonas sp.]|nr:hypothetical protein [Candidatus Saccharimonas sp.]